MKTLDRKRKTTSTGRRMRMHCCFLLALLGALATPPPANAQRGAVALRGLVFDSLRGLPLKDAFVTIGGAVRPITTDSRGLFRFDSVPPGVHTVTAQHALLDSIGLSGLGARITVGDTGAEVRLAVPSFGTMWRVSCQGRPPPDSGIVFGTIRDAIGRDPVANASVEVTWLDLLLDTQKGVIQRRWRIETRSNAHGGYALCGVAPEGELRIRAGSDSAASGVIQVASSTLRVQRRDLFIGPAPTASSPPRGTIMGVITDVDGRPLERARIIREDSSEALSDPAGRFTLSGVPVGTRQLEIIAIGAVPLLVTIDVMPPDTAIVAVQLQKVLALDAVRTAAPRGARVLAAEFEARRKSGFGYARDSTDISRYDQFVNVLRDVPGLNVQLGATSLAITVADGKGGNCGPDVLIDGAPAAFGHLIDLMPREIAGIEVFARAAQVPLRFLLPGVRPQCGMILVWTKYGFRNR